MKLLPFSVEEVNSITRLTQVDNYLSRLHNIDSRNFDVPNCGGHSIDAGMIYIDKDFDRRWMWLGRPILATPYVILRELYTMSLIDALRELQGRELQELLIRMRMVNRDDSPIEHSYSVGNAALLYAVELQHGRSGYRAFERFMDGQAKRPERLVILPPDLRRMP